MRSKDAIFNYNDQSHQMEKLLQKGAPAYILQCQEMELLTCEGDMDKQPEIQDLIRKNYKVFQELPMDLPPNRKIKHIIEIEPGTKTASSKPYICPHQRRCDSSHNHCCQIRFEDKASLKGRQCNNIIIINYY